MAKIVLWDLETTDLPADGGWLLSFAWKELGKDKIHLHSIRDYRGWNKELWDDSKLVTDLKSALSDADVWVTWFGKRFDVPYANTRCLNHRFGPLPPVAHVDLWEIARGRLKFRNNRMGTVSDFLFPVDGSGAKKTPLTMMTWRKAAAGHVPSLKLVEEHNVADIKVLEQTYKLLIPYASRSQHPDLGFVIAGKYGLCAACGADSLQSRGWQFCQKIKYRRIHCSQCGWWGKGQIIK